VGINFCIRKQLRYEVTHSTSIETYNNYLTDYFNKEWEDMEKFYLDV
jgi:hypothetical protein